MSRVLSLDLVRERRRVNLGRMLDKYSGPTVSAWTGISPSYLWQMVAGEGKSRRHISDKTAEKIEKALKLPQGWLSWNEDDGNVLAVGKRMSADGSPTPPETIQSQPMQQEPLTIAIQLVEEVLEKNDLSLPIPKRAALIASVYELIESGLPQAKVLRFVQAAIA